MVNAGNPPLPSARRLRFGLSARLALSTALLGVIVAGVLTAYMYRGSADAVIAGELRELAATNGAAGQRFNARMTFAREDAQILAQVCEVVATLPAQTIGAASPEGVGQAPLILDRIQRALQAMLEQRPNYVQVQYIGADGHEDIRIQRLPGGAIASAPADALGDLSNSAEFRDARRLAKGGVHISDFDLSRIGGPPEVPHRSIVRVAAPVFDSGRELLGVVVINLDLGELLGIVTGTARQQSSHFVANESGDYIYQPDPAKTFGYLLGHRYRMQDDVPRLETVFGDGGSDFSGVVTMDGQQYLTDTRRIHYDPGRPKRYLVLATMWPRINAAREIAGLRDRTLLVAGLLLLVGVAAAISLARHFVRPLRVLTEAARRIAAGSRKIEMDEVVRRNDEVGDLARSFAVMAAEITQREEEISRTAANRARSEELAQFAYVASHDLQEPLRMVDSYLGLLERRYADRLDGEAHEFIGYAVDGARRMKMLINDLLEYSRVTNQPLKVEEVDVAAVVSRLVVALAGRVAECGVDIFVASLPRLEADPVQMERLLMNLIENAVKYRSEEAPQVQIAAERKGSAWEFSVTDNGIGIEPEFREKVFEIFKRLHSREKYPGTGIGLASCRRIVDRHGGTIWIDPTPGGGTTVRFTLPDGQAKTEKHDER